MKRILFFIFVLSIPFIFTSCAQKTQKSVKESAFSAQQLVYALVTDLSPNIRDVISEHETVVIPDFVNTSNYQNKSQLGFLLSSMVKNIAISRYNLEVREVALRQNFAIGPGGFNTLSRNPSTLSKDIGEARYALVGTYSFTDVKMHVFLQIIDVYSGNVISTSQKETKLVDTILKLEGIYQTNQPVIYEPIVL